MASEKDSMEKLMVYQQDLQAEEECLKKIIAKLNAQAHALQVEQLHILNAINKNNASKTAVQSQPTTDGRHLTVKKEMAESTVPELDLTVPSYQSCEEDDDEMEF